MSGARSATKWRDQTIVRLLEKLSRHGELSEEDSVLMERTVRRLKPRREVWRWTEEEDRQIKRLIARRPIRLRYVRYAKPFKRNDEVRVLAEKLGRSEWAVYRRMERLRKCSEARKRRKGVGSKHG